MPTPANIRAFQATAESYDGGNGNLRTFNVPGVAAAAIAPYITSYTMTAAMAVVLPTDGSEILFRNRSADWFTVIGNTTDGSGPTPTLPVAFPVAPHGMLFWPNLVVTSVTPGNTLEATTPAPTNPIEFDIVAAKVV